MPAGKKSLRPRYYDEDFIEKKKIEAKSKKSSPGIAIFITLMIIFSSFGVFLYVDSQKPVDEQIFLPFFRRSVETGGGDYALTESVKTIDGDIIALSSFQGKTLILYFTGASCIPCKQQLPFLINSYNQYKSTGKVEVVSLDIQGQSIDALKAWRQENAITWYVCQDTGTVLSSKFSIYSMPTLVILDGNGNEKTRYVGAQSEATIQQIFQEAVG